jgi:hypothetical protein
VQISTCLEATFSFVLPCFEEEEIWKCPCSRDRTVFVRKDIFELETLSKKFEEENGIIDAVRKQMSHGSSTHSYFNCINHDAEYFPYCNIHIDAFAEVQSISETRVLPYDLNKPYPAASTTTFSFGPHDYSTQSDVRLTPEFLILLNCIGATKMF